MLVKTIITDAEEVTQGGHSNSFVVPVDLSGVRRVGVVALDRRTLAPIGIPEIDVLRLVQASPGGRDRSSGRWQAETASLIFSALFSAFRCWLRPTRNEGRRTNKF